jgi:hypothetical protein
LFSLLLGFTVVLVVAALVAVVVIVVALIQHIQNHHDQFAFNELILKQQDFSGVACCLRAALLSQKCKVYEESSRIAGGTRF